MAILCMSKIASLVTSDTEDFKARVDKGEPVDRILISPFEHASLGPTSYDLHIGDQYISLLGKPHVKRVGEQPLRIEPRESFTIVSREYIGLPYDKAGIIFAKVSWLERGLSQISSYIHPGFHGRLSETLTNTTDHPLEIDPGSAFCQIVFFEVPEARPNERYSGGRLGQSVDSIMQSLIALHSNPRAAEAVIPSETRLRVMPPERKTFRGFLRYLLGERRIECSEADLARIAQSSRWEILSSEPEEKCQLK